MNGFENIYSVIESINTSVKKIDEEVTYIEKLGNITEQMGEYSEDIKKYHTETVNSYNNAISRIQVLNNLIANELLADYKYIFKELNSKCEDIIAELVQSVNNDSIHSSTLEPTEVLDITPAPSEENTAFKNAILRPDIVADKKITSIGKRDETIPIPKPVEPKIEILEM